MNERIRELFEKHTVPNFAVGDNLDLSKNLRGEYVNPTLEDHWQTFQEAAELVVGECADICINKNVSNIDLDVIRESGKFTLQDIATKSCGENLSKLIKKHFGVAE